MRVKILTMCGVVVGTLFLFGCNDEEAVPEPSQSVLPSWESNPRATSIEYCNQVAGWGEVPSPTTLVDLTTLTDVAHSLQTAGNTLSFGGNVYGAYDAYFNATVRISTEWGKNPTAGPGFVSKDLWNTWNAARSNLLSTVATTCVGKTK